MEEAMSSTKRHGTVALVAIGAAVVGFLPTVILAPSAYAQQFRGGDELKISDGYITMIKAKKHKLRFRKVYQEYNAGTDQFASIVAMIQF
jgi:hypothetical protein